MAGSALRNGSDSPSSHATVSAGSESGAPLLGADAEALILCNQKLQELGIDSTIKLPQICVVGNQSTGKSSLIEAISTVKVPKARGLCTQCPIAINLSAGPKPDSPWTCSVSIEKRYDYNHAYNNRRAQNKKSYLGPWQERATTELVHIKKTHDKNEVTELIKAAQWIILNPGTRYQDYIEQADDSQEQLTLFSPNAVRLDISEASWPNLSFVDLPGVIANTGANEKDRHLVGMIKSLVQKYASAERSVNMLTLPMDHDIANSTACAIIQDLKVQDRTLAVFTKADKADKDLKTSFLNKFFGKEDDLGFHHGYHFVIMPEDEELDEARQTEESMFDKEPWADLAPEFRSRLGIPALRDHLRGLLFEKIRETLPSNLKSIEDRLSMVDGQLMTLPEPANAALLPLQLQQTITRFETALKMLFTGELTNGELFNDSLSATMQWTETVDKFKTNIGKAKPTVFLETRSELSRLKKANSVINALRSQNGPDADTVMLSSDDEADTVSHPPVKVKSEEQNGAKLNAAHRFLLEEIRKINQRYYQASVPGEIELKAISEMNRLSVKHWHELLNKFMNECRKILHKQVDGVFHDVFDEYQHLELYQVIQDHVKDYLDRAFQHEWDAMKDLCRMEQETPMTCQLHRLKEHELKCLEDRVQKRAARRIEIATAELNASESTVKKRKEIDLNIPQPDPYGTELRMSAKTRAYYEVASARFTDNVNSRIFGCLLPACNEELVDSLKQFLGLNDHTKHDQIVVWMTEDQAREQLRRSLLYEKKQLTEGRHFIQEVLAPKKKRRSPLAEPVVSPTKRVKQAHTGRVFNSPLNSTPSKLLSKHVDRMNLEPEEDE